MKSLRECLELIISIQDAVTIIIIILFIGQTVSVIVLVIIGNTVTIIIIILIVGNAVIVIIIIHSVSQTVLVRVNITPEGGDGAREEAQAEEEDDLVHVRVCPLIPM